jgi:allantoicase
MAANPIRNRSGFVNWDAMLDAFKSRIDQSSDPYAKTVSKLQLKRKICAISCSYSLPDQNLGENEIQTVTVTTSQPESFSNVNTEELQYPLIICPTNQYFNKDEIELFEHIVTQRFPDGGRVCWKLFRKFWKSIGMKRRKDSNGTKTIFDRDEDQLKSRYKTVKSSKKRSNTNA